MHVNNHFANTNQTNLFFQPRFGYIDINGRNSRWLHHDNVLLYYMAEWSVSNPCTSSVLFVCLLLLFFFWGVVCLSSLFCLCVEIFSLFVYTVGFIYQSFLQESFKKRGFQQRIQTALFHILHLFLNSLPGA